MTYYLKESPKEEKKLKVDYERNEALIKKTTKYIKPKPDIKEYSNKNENDNKEENINKSRNINKMEYTNNYNENNNKEEKPIFTLRGFIKFKALSSPEYEFFKNSKIQKEVVIKSVLCNKNLDIQGNNIQMALH